MQTPSGANREAEAAKMRAAMPELSAIIDDLRRVFGAVRVTYAKEGTTVRGVPFEERYPQGIL